MKTPTRSLTRIFGGAAVVLGGACVGLPPYAPEIIDHDPPGLSPVTVSFGRKADILFIIDNTGSMGEEQALLGHAMDRFVEALDDAEIDYRVGVTTTDNSNPWCQGTEPEAGDLRLSSCRARASEFVFEGATTINSFSEACEDLCPPEWGDVEPLPTTTRYDPETGVRPWIEVEDGQSNLPVGLTVAQALQCILPQGIDGCGFESQLESMGKAIKRAETPSEESYGFLREDAVLMVVNLTDEADCSYNSDWETIFLPDQDRVFWSDPDAPAPTSATCWNAGVACSGSGSGAYDECHSVNLDADGNEVDDASAEANAVLFPLSRFVTVLQGAADLRQRHVGGTPVLMALIAGVNADGSITYQDATDDPQYQRDFGIGPGCDSSAGEAVPPVRLAELARQFAPSDRNIFSVCAPYYSDTMTAIADSIAEQFSPPGCVHSCLYDTDPSTEALNPSCVVDVVQGPSSAPERTDLPRCTGDATLPCFRVAMDGALLETGQWFFTDDPSDDISAACANEGWNAEIVIEGADLIPRHAVLEVECDEDLQKTPPCGIDSSEP